MLPVQMTRLQIKLIHYLCNYIKIFLSTYFGTFCAWRSILTIFALHTLYEETSSHVK